MPSILALTNNFQTQSWQHCCKFIYACILWTLRRYFPLFKKLREYVRICECSFHNSYKLNTDLINVFIYLRKCIFVQYRAALQARPNDAFLWNRLGASLGNIFTPTYILTYSSWILLRINLKMVEILKIHTMKMKRVGRHSLPKAFMKSFIHARNGHRPMQ